MASFLDANIFMYAAGREHPNKEPCLKLIEKIINESYGENQFFSNTEVLQEILYRYTALRLHDMAQKVFHLTVSLPIHFLPIRIEEMFEAQKLLLHYPDISTRDAVHASCMRNAGLVEIYTYDQGFSKLKFLERLEPDCI